MSSSSAFRVSVPASRSWKCTPTTLGQLLGALAARLPSLAEIIEDDRLHPAFVANVNGERFVNDPATPLDAGDCVLILSADAGG